MKVLYCEKRFLVSGGRRGRKVEFFFSPRRRPPLSLFSFLPRPRSRASSPVRLSACARRTRARAWRRRPKGRSIWRAVSVFFFERKRLRRSRFFRPATTFLCSNNAVSSPAALDNTHFARPVLQEDTPDHDGGSEGGSEGDGKCWGGWSGELSLRRMKKSMGDGLFEEAHDSFFSLFLRAPCCPVVSIFLVDDAAGDLCR